MQARICNGFTRRDAFVWSLSFLCSDVTTNIVQQVDGRQSEAIYGRGSTKYFWRSSPEELPASPAYWFQQKWNCTPFILQSHGPSIPLRRFYNQYWHSDDFWLIKKSHHFKNRLEKICYIFGRPFPIGYCTHIIFSSYSTRCMHIKSA